MREIIITVVPLKYDGVLVPLKKMKIKITRIKSLIFSKYYDFILVILIFFFFTCH